MLAQWMKESKRTVIFSGAGMSTESGLPDFRSALQGIWKGKDPALFASTHALRHNRQAFVEFYRMRIEGLQQCRPHIGHHILAKWEKQGHLHAVITQNVDGFHQEAGSQNVAELHGTLATVHCQTCLRDYPSAKYLEQDGTVCECGGFLRPSVVLFGETLPEKALATAEEEMLLAEVCIVLGSSLQVSPANWYPRMAKENGAKLVIVNMEPTELDDLADLVISDQKIGTFLQNLDVQL